MKFKGGKAKYFLTEKNDGWELLQQYLEDPTVMPKDLSRINISSLNNPYKNMVWLLVMVVHKESTTTIPRIALYIFHFAIHGKAIFYWAKIISGQLSFQL